jgi:hypothetical protein
MRPELYDAAAWEIFLAKLADLRAKNLEGEALFSELEKAWAHMFEGCDQDAAREILFSMKIFWWPLTTRTP